MSARYSPAPRVTKVIMELAELFKQHKINSAMMSEWEREAVQEVLIDEYIGRVGK